MYITTVPQSLETADYRDPIMNDNNWTWAMSFQPVLLTFKLFSLICFEQRLEISDCGSDAPSNLNEPKEYFWLLLATFSSSAATLQACWQDFCTSL